MQNNYTVHKHDVSVECHKNEIFYGPILCDVHSNGTSREFLQWIHLDCNPSDHTRISKTYRVLFMFLIFHLMESHSMFLIFEMVMVIMFLRFSTDYLSSLNIWIHRTYLCVCIIEITTLFSNVF